MGDPGFGEAERTAPTENHARVTPESLAIEKG